MIEVRTATLANVTPTTVTPTTMTFSTGLTFSIPINQGDNVLFKEQTAAAQNGVWQCASTDRKNWVRPASANTWNKHVGLRAHVVAGSLQNEIWLCTVDVGGTLGDTPITFVKEAVATTGLSEVLTSLPRQRPTCLVKIDVTPHSPGPVIHATAYDTYTWTPQNINDDPGEAEALPGMYYHNIDTELTFRAKIIRSADIPNIVEVRWDFGDGTEALAIYDEPSDEWRAAHTYKIASPGIIAHCQARDANGEVAYANMNMMLQT